jgi:hypothetical protein
MVFDRLKGAFQILARGAHATIDYQAHYRAKVLKQASNHRRVDVQPVLDKLPAMANIPLRVGVPGLEVVLLPGDFVLVGFENGQPDLPYATLWEAGPNSPTPVKLTLHVSSMELGGPSLVAPVDGIVRAETPCQYTGAPHFVSGKTSLTILAKK